MRHATNEKWHTTHNGRSRTTISSSHRTHGEKETYEYLRILEADTIKCHEKTQETF